MYPECEPGFSVQPSIAVLEALNCLFLVYIASEWECWKTEGKAKGYTCSSSVCQFLRRADYHQTSAIAPTSCIPNSLFLATKGFSPVAERLSCLWNWDFSPALMQGPAQCQWCTCTNFSFPSFANCTQRSCYISNWIVPKAEAAKENYPKINCPRLCIRSLRHLMLLWAQFRSSSIWLINTNNAP